MGKTSEKVWNKTWRILTTVLIAVVIPPGMAAWFIGFGWIGGGAPITGVGYVLLGVAWLDWFQHPLGSFSALVRSALGWGCLAHAQDLEAQAPSHN